VFSGLMPFLPLKSENPLEGCRDPETVDRLIANTGVYIDGGTLQGDLLSDDTGSGEHHNRGNSHGRCYYSSRTLGCQHVTSSWTYLIYAASPTGHFGEVA
jgi:hypothetical protein